MCFAPDGGSNPLVGIKTFSPIAKVSDVEAFDRSGAQGRWFVHKALGLPPLKNENRKDNEISDPLLETDMLFTDRFQWHGGFKEFSMAPRGTPLRMKIFPL